MTPIHNTFRTYLRAPDQHKGDGGARTKAPGRTPEPALQPERARKKMASWRRREEWWDWGWRGRSRWLGEKGQEREGEGARAEVEAGARRRRGGFLFAPTNSLLASSPHTNLFEFEETDVGWQHAYESNTSHYHGNIYMKATQVNMMATNRNM